jgi:transcription initiation factor TFIIB
MSTILNNKDMANKCNDRTNERIKDTTVKNNRKRTDINNYTRKNKNKNNKTNCELWGKYLNMEIDINSNSNECNDKTKFMIKNLHNSGIENCNNEELNEVIYSDKTTGVVDLGERSFCELCHSDVEYNEDGFLTCKNRKCGKIYKDITNKNAEWRFFGCDDNGGGDQTRCGMPINPLLQESSFGCKVLNGRYTNEMRKIRRYTEWQSMPYKEKSQYDEFQYITTLASNSGLPRIIIDGALLYYKKISEQKTYRGLNRDGIIAASVYIACRINSYPRTSHEIALMFYLDNASATKGCKNAISIINELESNMEQNEKTVLCMTKPSSFIPRFCSKLNISSELSKLCEFIAIRVENTNMIPENTPNSIAAGIIYFIIYYCNLGISKSCVSDISEISEVTINKCYKKLEQNRNLLIPNMIKKKYNIQF